MLSLNFKLEKSTLFSKNPYQWWRIATFMLLGFMIGTLVLSGIAVYNYTFRSLEDAHTIVLLNTDTVANNINIGNYNRAVELVAAKDKEIVIPQNTRNIFSYSSAAPITKPSTTSTATTTVN